MRHVIAVVASALMIGSAFSEELPMDPTGSFVDESRAYTVGARRGECELLANPRLYSESYERTKKAENCGRSINHFLVLTGRGDITPARAQCGAGILASYPKPDATIREALEAGFDARCR
jgi:hypothetical protein